MGLFDRIDAFLAERGMRDPFRVAQRYRVGGLPEGTRGRVSGVVKPFEGRVIEAPLSGRPCVFYEIVIYDTQQANIELAREQRGVPFLLEDGTGRALVDPELARSSCAFDHTTYSKAAFDADPRQRALLDRFSLVKRNWWNTLQIRYREAVIAPAESVTVVGAGVREPDPDGPLGAERGYREAGPTRMRVTGTKKHPILLTDDPRLA